MAFQNSSRHYTLDQLCDGVYAAFARDGGAAISNAGLVDLGNSTLVVDTFLTPSAAEELRADAQRLMGRMPGRVVNTHYHNDHIWGNQVFLPEADLISSIETRVLIQTAGKEEYNEYRAITSDRLKELLAQKTAAQTGEQRAALELRIGYFAGLERDLPRLRVTLPNLVFEKRMGLYGSTRRAELIAFSGAHSGSDTVVYLPYDGIVFMSDLLFVRFHPYLADGSPDRWLEVLHSVLDGTAGIENTERFIPGHGPTGTRADLERLADYIYDCQHIAQKLVQEGKISQSDVAAVPIPAAYADWTMPSFFYSNLRFLLEKYKNAANKSTPSKPKTVSN